MKTDDLILRDVSLVTMDGWGENPWGCFPDGVVAITNGHISYAGPAVGFQAGTNPARTISMAGCLALPGLVCCHNTPLWARGAEETLPRDGEAYKLMVEQRARLTSMVDDDTLIGWAQERLTKLQRSGVTACEIKTGFGLTVADELRLALLARRLQGKTALQTMVTLYAGHFIPVGADPDQHIEELVKWLLPEIEKHRACDACEVLCDDEGGLDLDRASTILEAFYRKKTPSRVSCDRFCDSAGATLPASFYSRSATYMSHSDEDGIASVSATGSVIVLVPGINVPDRGSTRPNIEAMRLAGAKLAIAPEIGPLAEDGGPLQAARLAVKDFGLTPEEALLGITAHAAKAIGMSNGAGTLRSGRRADLAFFRASSPEHLIGTPGLWPAAVMTSGRLEEFA